MPVLKRRADWEPHLQLVFSVLVGVAFAQSFAFISAEAFSLYQLLLIATVFFVVLDNWYNLTVELAYQNVRDGPMVWVYVLSLIAYSCLPFLYLSREASTAGSVGPPEFLLMNLSAICVLDATRRFLEVRHRTKHTEDVSEKEQQRIGEQIFLVGTGYIYFFVLASVAAFYTGLRTDVRILAGSVPVIWLLIRGVDNILIPRFSKWLYAVVLRANTQTNTSNENSPDSDSPSA